MKIIIDNAIPFIEGVFDKYATVVYKEGSAICHQDLLDVDAMIIRTRTKCNRALLEGTSVKIIATATIGLDHIDQDYCLRQHIHVSNAAGCNAGGVMNYVFSAMFGCASRKSIPIGGATLGIVGVGHVGSLVAQMARSLGMRLLLCDPPRAEKEATSQFVDLDTLLTQSDIVTLHVPLNDSTRHMANDEFFSKMKLGAFFINSARGEIVDENALKRAIPSLGPVIIDTWNNEPNIDKELLQMVDIATPHIAGYSYQGKQRGTASAVRAVARFFDIKPLFEFFPPATEEKMKAVRVDLKELTQSQIAAVFQYNYPIFTDDFMFRVSPDSFETLRAEYSFRPEFFID